MKDILQRLRGAVANRLEDRGAAVAEPGSAPGALMRQHVQGDVQATAMRFSSYRWVLVITAIAAFYYAFIVSDRYITEAQLYVKSTAQAAPAVPQLSLLSGGDQARDGLVLQEYIHSLDMLRHLDEKIGLLEHFSGSGWDFLSRLASDPTQEDFLAYFRKKVSVQINAESSVIAVRGQAFTAEYSKLMVEEILKEAERFINSINQRIASEEIRFIEQELKRARDEVTDARSRMLKFQNENQLLDPSASGAALQKVVSELEAVLVELETEHKVLKSYLNEKAPQVVSLQDRILSVKAQLAEERRKMADQDSQSINDVYARFQELELEFEFASQKFKTALQALEKARIESYHKLKHLVVVQSPSLPDEALAPRKLYNLATLFVLLSIAYGIITMILATIREHRDV